MNRSCETYQEQLTLRLYDELDSNESSALDDHLHGCDACRAFASELDAGLGQLQTAPVADDLPDGWREALRRSVVNAPKPIDAPEPIPPRRRAALARTALTFAAGLAAGLLVMLSVRSYPEATPSAEDGAARVASVQEAEPFTRETPPPPATSRGQLARLATLMRN